MINKHSIKVEGEHYPFTYDEETGAVVAPGVVPFSVAHLLDARAILLSVYYDPSVQERLGKLDWGKNPRAAWIKKYPDVPNVPNFQKPLADTRHADAQWTTQAAREAEPEHTQVEER